MSLGMEVGLGPGDFALDGDPTTPPQKGRASGVFSEFSACVYCGHQTAGWMKLVLGMAVGLSLGDFVLDGDPAPSPPSPKGAQTPNFRPFGCCGQMAAWIKMSLGMELGLDPGDFVLDGDPPNFRPMFIVTKWLDGRS